MSIIRESICKVPQTTLVCLIKFWLLTWHHVGFIPLNNSFKSTKTSWKISKLEHFILFVWSFKSQHLLLSRFLPPFSFPTFDTYLNININAYMFSYIPVQTF